jgi:hypothetical protein
MEDLVSLLIFGAVFIFSLLAGGKKKRAQQQRPPVRPQPRAAVEQRRSTAQSATAATPTRQPKPGGEPPELVEGLLDLLRGRIPLETRTPQVEPEPRVDIDDEAQSLMEVPDRAQEHQEFHDKYVEHSVPATVTWRPRSRYRLTPKTAREAVVWTAIFTKPKGLE